MTGQAPLAGQGREVDDATSLTVIHRAVVVTLTRDLTAAVLQRLRADVLACVQRERATAVVFDVTGLQLMDPVEFHDLQQTAAMVRLLGTRSVLAGLQPSVVEVLSVLGADTRGFDATVASVHDGLRLVDPPGPSVSTGLGRAPRRGATGRP